MGETLRHHGSGQLADLPSDASILIATALEVGAEVEKFRQSPSYRTPWD
jgi:hypothetical protein